MANMYPTIEEIKLLRPKPTDGEMNLLNKLNKELDI